MQCRFYNDAAPFYADVYPVLMRGEARNMLPLGNLLVGYEGKDKTGWRDPARWLMAAVWDALGNLLTYADYEYTWKKGGQLAGISSSSFDATYKYDYTGLRASKTVDNVTTKFLWVGGLLM